MLYCLIMHSCVSCMCDLIIHKRHHYATWPHEAGASDVSVAVQSWHSLGHKIEHAYTMYIGSFVTLSRPLPI